jgi:hypothetical protein
LSRQNIRYHDFWSGFEIPDTATLSWDCNCVKCRDNKVIHSNICTVYSENNTDNINNINYVVTQSESKEILHSLIDGNDYELTVEVEEEYFNTIYIFYKINDIFVVIDYKQNVN